MSNRNCRLARGASGVLAAFAMTLACSAQADWNVNLITNAGFESGPSSPNGQTVVAPTGWISIGNGTVVPYGAGAEFPTSSSPGPDARGNNFLAGGPNNTLAQVVQQIDLSALGEQIDANNANFNLGAWLGGFANQDDLARVVVVWADASSNSLRTDTLVGPNAQVRGGVTGLSAYWTSSRVPVNTRQALVTITLSRVIGPYNNGYIDNLWLVLSPQNLFCDSIDFNNDTSVFDPVDIDAFLSVYSEGPCVPDTATCNDIDFNNDASIFDPADIDAFLRVYSEGPCVL
ncbi:MAG: hypothetical protein U0640_02640 [Phycisphaerales bacterium]